MPSIRLHWLHDTRRDGLSWVNRLTSHELTHSTQARNREAWTALLDDLGLRYRFVTPAQLADDALTKQGFRALVLPRSIAKSAREVEKIESFLAAGKLVIADCQPGLYTGHLVRRATPALDRLLGIRRKGRDVHLDGERVVPRARNAGLPYPVAEPKLFAAGARPRHRADGVPALLVGPPPNGPQGRPLYLNLLIFDYVRDRILDPARARWLREQVGGVLRHGGVRPLARITRAPGTSPLPIGLRVRRDGSDLIIALHSNVITGSVPVPWERILKTPSIPVRLTFEGTWTVTDMLSRAPLGTANRIEVSVPIDRPVLLRLSRQ